MKRLVAVVFLLWSTTVLFAQGGITALAGGEGILQRVDNASVTASGDGFAASRKDHAAPVVMTFRDCQGLGVDRADGQWWVLPIGDTEGSRAEGRRVEPVKTVAANHGFWVLPVDAHSRDRSWYLELTGGKATATRTAAGLRVAVDADSFAIRNAEARPHSDPFGNRFSVKIAGGDGLEDALAGFYWGTILPLVAEKTVAAGFPYHDGYVLSTLNVKAYAGSYPAVDHEFQTKGRMAMGSELDLDVVKRMIGLQIQLMKDDPEGLWRAPCAVQPNGNREYHVRRSSEDGRVNAAMFPVTGNIEVIEEASRYYAARKDTAWLKENIESLEHAAGWTMAHVDQYGRLWGDVYYEDQVMKDGRETQIQGFGARSFELLAGLERVLGRGAKAEEYAALAKKMAQVLVSPLPMGYWDEGHGRFVDWVDRDSRVHDHVHLVANSLPVTYGYATAAQTEAVAKLVDANDGALERFPSFLAVDIAGYNKSEIGDGGPYDLSAAGRYWYWDAAYREWRGQNGVLLDQVKAVAAEGAKDSNYFMGERYDMDYVYYVDGKNAHGAEKYYEYPNVYAAVLISKVLGLTVPADADLSVAPHLAGYGAVEFGVPAYAVRYEYSASGFSLRNLSEKKRRIVVDLSGLGDGKGRYSLKGKAGTRFTAELAAGEEARWVAEQ